MAVEIRELKIRGIVSNNSLSRKGIVREFDNRNSSIFNTNLIKDLRQDILMECKELIENEIERLNQR